MNMQAYFGFKIKNLETLGKFCLLSSPPPLQCCSHVTLLSHLNIAEGKGACMGVSRIFDIGCSYCSKVVYLSICHFRNEKGTGAEMRRAMVCRIVFGDAAWSVLHQPAQQEFPFCFGAKKDRGTGFSVLAAREMKRGPKNERGGGEGEGRMETSLIYKGFPLHGCGYVELTALTYRLILNIS